jgi:hypothetical protein
VGSRRNKNLREIVEQALQRFLKGQRKKKFRLKLTPHRAVGRLLPGVDLTDRDSLYDIMDGLR